MSVAHMEERAMNLGILRGVTKRNVENPSRHAWNIDLVFSFCHPVELRSHHGDEPVNDSIGKAFLYCDNTMVLAGEVEVERPFGDARLFGNVGYGGLRQSFLGEETFG